MASEATNSRAGVGAGVGAGGGPSPFSRPPQPKPMSMYDRPPDTAARPNGAAPAKSPTPPATASAGAPDAARTALQSQCRNGALWFYWVAALSLINSAVAIAGQEWRFILGLGVTQIVQELAQESGSADLKAGLVSLVVIGLFAFLGFKAIQGYGWAFVVGMSLYAADGVIFLLAQDWVGVGFHAFALVMIMRGYQAARAL